MQAPSGLTETKDPITRSSPYTCIKCRRGVMLPAIEEGEPEYTEQYVCQSCGFHDSIPTMAIIASQFLSSVIGIGICSYLLSHHMSILNQDIPLSGSQVLQHLLLVLISATFVVGFVYVLYQSFKGTNHRRAYTRGPEKTPAVPPI